MWGLSQNMQEVVPEKIMCGGPGKNMWGIKKIINRLYLLRYVDYSISTYAEYAVYSKRNAHLILIFFVAPLGEGGQKFT